MRLMNAERRAREADATRGGTLLERVVRRINETQRPPSLNDAFHEGPYDRGRRAGLHEAETILRQEWEREESPGKSIP